MMQPNSLHQIQIKEICNPRELFDYKMAFTAPYHYEAGYSIWEKSYLRDIDGEGRALFSELKNAGRLFRRCAGRVDSVRKDCVWV